MLLPSLDLSTLSRRELLRRAFLCAGGLGTLSILGWPSTGRGADSPIVAAGPLGEPDALGVRLPPGWAYRIVAVSGERPVATSSYRWHPFPDGGATFATADGGWIYVNNSEFPLQGGVGALRFSADGTLADAYRVLDGTNLNCAGGPTPWQTWLSCEEATAGQVWECDPMGQAAGRVLPALGRFAHEAVTIDPWNKIVYLTEDDGSGRLYRFVCSRSDWSLGCPRAALADGQLQVLRVRGLSDGSLPSDTLDVSEPMAVEWVDVVSPELPQSIVRERMGPAAPGSVFKGGEGIWYFDGIVYFSTKGDDRIWAYDVTRFELQAIYDFATAVAPDDILSGVDNLTVSACGDILVAEDGGNMELCAILPDRSLKAIFQIEGQPESELTGLAFSPDGRRIYVNSQRGRRGAPGVGTTYEVRMA